MRLNDLTGQRFGRLTVMERAPKRGKHTYWRCKCDCGRECAVEAYNLVHGHTKSCGCYKTDYLIRLKTTHGMSSTRLYNIWLDMIRRCEKTSRDNYKYYGGRGIRVCEEWHNFLNFEKWALSNGYEEYLTIDRTDTDGDYSPENCRWVSWQSQNNNRRCNRIIEIAGLRMTLTQAAQIYGISRATLYQRLNSGMAIEKALDVKPGVYIRLEEPGNATDR